MMDNNDVPAEKITKSTKPFPKLIEDAVIALKEIEKQLNEPLVGSKLLIEFDP